MILITYIKADGTEGCALVDLPDLGPQLTHLYADALIEDRVAGVPVDQRNRWLSAAEGSALAKRLDEMFAK